MMNFVSKNDEFLWKYQGYDVMEMMMPLIGCNQAYWKNGHSLWSILGVSPQFSANFPPIFRKLADFDIWCGSRYQYGNPKGHRECPPLLNLLRMSVEISAFSIESSAENVAIWIEIRYETNGPDTTNDDFALKIWYLQSGSNSGRSRATTRCVIYTKHTANFDWNGRFFNRKQY